VVPLVEVTTWSLEQRDRSQLRPAGPPRAPARLEQATVVLPELNRFLYTAVGGDWWWTDRLGWTYADWLSWLDRPEVTTWIASVGGTPAGYVELEGQDGGAVELAYFGLVPRFVGLGVGGWLLHRAVEAAWDEPGTRRVWVHTCSLDHPAALANYQARGFEVVAVEVSAQELEDQPPGPWPGAGARPPR
jgi:GNAT superfamily N-acetyltransferase